MPEKWTPRSSALARMAGNIAAGLVTASPLRPSPTVVAHLAVQIAIEIATEIDEQQQIDGRGEISNNP